MDVSNSNKLLRILSSKLYASYEHKMLKIGKHNGTLKVLFSLKLWFSFLYEGRDAFFEIFC